MFQLPHRGILRQGGSDKKQIAEHGAKRASKTKMKFLNSTLGFIAIAALLLVGCDSFVALTPTPAPTETPTSIPTATAAPTARPRATPAKEGALPPAIAFALNKTQNVRSLDFDFSTGITRVHANQTTELPGLAIKGQDSTLNRNVVISGMTSDTNEFITYQVIVLGENVYIKGLTDVPGIDPTLWYQLPADLQNAARSMPSARGLLNSFVADDLAAAQFHSVGAETLDDENCTVWAAQNPPAIQKIIGVNDSATLEKQLGEIDRSELKIWTCADGYIRKIQGQVLGHNAQVENDTVSINLYFKMNQFDQAFEIQAPPDAQPFAPQQDITATLPPTALPVTPTAKP